LSDVDPAELVGAVGDDPGHTAVTIAGDGDLRMSGLDPS